MRPNHSFSGLLALSGLARSSFYYRRGAAARADRHGALKARIAAIFAEHKGRYGYRRVTAAIRALGETVNHKTVQKLMVEMGLKSTVRPKKYKSWRGEIGCAAPDLLQRRFDADRPNRKWTTDVTEFGLPGGKLYLSPVLDLFNGEIVAFEMSDRPTFALVRDMLTKALRRLGPNERPILHSDQGWHYRMSAFKRLLAAHDMPQSMSRKGNCLDNAAMESFFATLKSELFHPARFDDADALRKAIVDYIAYYNNDRLKLKLKGLSPVQYRTQPSYQPAA